MLIHTRMNIKHESTVRYVITCQLLLHDYIKQTESGLNPGRLTENRLDTTRLTGLHELERSLS